MTKDKEYTTRDSEIPDLTWEDILAFECDREFDYWVTVNGHDEEKSMEEDILYTIKNEPIHIYYDEDTNSIDVKSEESSSRSSSLSSSFSSTSSQSSLSESDRPAIVKLYTDAETKNLFAVCNSNVNVGFTSHCLKKGEKQTLEPNVSVKVFAFDSLFYTLTSEAFINYDPSEAKLSFESKSGSKSSVTLTSKAASGLFESLTD